jgi:NAD(P)-dependent dehydrogenase (short-subunit alcohol dehydrogenase family)
LLKTVAAEWPGVVAKAIDFDPGLSPDEIAAHIVDELIAHDNHLEVGYPSGQRTIFRTVAATLNRTSEARLEPAADWVMLATGGARGITAEVVRSLAVPQMTIIMVGHTPLDPNEPSDTAGVHDVSQLREILTARKNGGARTPAQIERELQALRRQREIKRNLEHLQGAGVNCEYRAVDVKDATVFGALIEEIYARHGRLDAVLHGAGVIDDKLLADKSVDSFDHVFDTKVDSTYILERHLRPSSLKLLALFSSVAARWGNRGQSDYAAANEVMNRFASRMSQKFLNTRVVALNWGPWSGSGLASEPVNRQFRERGIIPIDPRTGCEFFMNEIRFGGMGDAEVIAGEGPWLSEADDAYDLGGILLGINELSENFWMM